MRRITQTTFALVAISASLVAGFYVTQLGGPPDSEPQAEPRHVRNELVVDAGDGELVKLALPVHWREQKTRGAGLATSPEGSGAVSLGLVPERGSALKAANDAHAALGFPGQATGGRCAATLVGSVTQDGQIRQVQMTWTGTAAGDRLTLATWVWNADAGDAPPGWGAEPSRMAAPHEPGDCT